MVDRTEASTRPRHIQDTAAYSGSPLAAAWSARRPGIELIDGWFAPKTVRRGTRGGLRLLTGLRTRPSGLARGRKLSLSFGDRDKSLIGPSNLAFLFESPSEI